MAMTNFPLFHLHSLISPQFSYFTTSCNSASANVEDEQKQRSLQVDERRKRRMISNRESAKRSRMRKKMHLDELSSQVVSLRAANRQLLDELNSVIGNRDQVIDENTKLCKEKFELEKKLERLH